jgi:hypothetical protein
MWEQAQKIAAQSASRIADNIANFLPGLLAFLVILIFSVILSWVVRSALVRFLRRIQFDRRTDQAGFSPLTEWSGSRSPTVVVSRLVSWTILLLGALVGLAALDTTVTVELTMPLLRYIPHLLAAGLILLVGYWVARFLGRSVLISAVNMEIHSARLLSLGVKWLILVLAGAMALEHLGIGKQIVLLAFAILFGGIVLALALAVGLGSKEMVSRSLERQFGEHPEEKEEIHHL